MNETNSISDNLVISRALLSDVTCVSCVSVIERRFSKEKGINVSVNFVTKKVKFSYDPKFWDESKITKVMHRLGYKISNFETEISN